jgi:hypothetical protein
LWFCHSPIAAFPVVDFQATNRFRFFGCNAFPEVLSHPTFGEAVAAHSPASIALTPIGRGSRIVICDTRRPYFVGSRLHLAQSVVMTNVSRMRRFTEA